MRSFAFLFAAATLFFACGGASATRETPTSSREAAPLAEADAQAETAASVDGGSSRATTLSDGAADGAPLTRPDASVGVPGADAGASSANACGPSFASMKALAGRGCSATTPCDYDDGRCECFRHFYSEPQVWWCAEKRKTCPATFAAASAPSAAGACTWVGGSDGCTYREGGCGCRTIPVGIRIDPRTPPSWTCEKAEPGCPYPMPKADTPCTREGATCHYRESHHTDAVCRGGKWALAPTPPPP